MKNIRSLLGNIVASILLTGIITMVVLFLGIEKKFLTGGPFLGITAYNIHNRVVCNNEKNLKRITDIRDEYDGYIVWLFRNDLYPSMDNVRIHLCGPRCIEICEVRTTNKEAEIAGGAGTVNIEIPKERDYIEIWPVSLEERTNYTFLVKVNIRDSTTSLEEVVAKTESIISTKYKISNLSPVIVGPSPRPYGQLITMTSAMNAIERFGIFLAGSMLMFIVYWVRNWIRGGKYSIKDD